VPPPSVFGVKVGVRYLELGVEATPRSQQAAVPRMWCAEVSALVARPPTLARLVWRCSEGVDVGPRDGTYTILH
jgi:hypothetical protein